MRDEDIQRVVLPVFYKLKPDAFATCLRVSDADVPTVAFASASLTIFDMFY